MKYKIEIMQWHSITETHESDDIRDIVEWFHDNWHLDYDRGYCAINVYEDGRELSWDEEYDLGFYDDDWEEE